METTFGQFSDPFLNWGGEKTEINTSVQAVLSIGLQLCKKEQSMVLNFYSLSWYGWLLNLKMHQWALWKSFKEACDEMWALPSHSCPHFLYRSTEDHKLPDKYLSAIILNQMNFSSLQIFEENLNWVVGCLWAAGWALLQISNTSPRAEK